ncbi:Protein transport protein tip20 [Astathelohania contejeani]|uniref:Protein transport protein tip20 n=1 Tax=Astathelohania contejeani TaxID=164912 RepID=A0ABQ7I0L6_9MICR|nr:Protein transport protein tip20 [Thelohania contejeani]
MEELVKEKTKLENTIQEIEKKNKKIAEKIKILEEEHSNLSNELVKVYNKISSKRSQFDLLVKEVSLYKSKELHEQRNNCIREYKEIIDIINRLNFVDLIKIYKSFVVLDEKINATIKYEILHKKIKLLYQNKKEELKNMLFNKISNLMDNPKKMHEVVYYFQFVRIYEIYFSENMVNSILYYHLSKGFTYHFLTDKQTNRLDKPEWAFQFLKEKYQAYIKYIKIYKSININDILIKILGDKEEKEIINEIIFKGLKISYDNAESEFILSTRSLIKTKIDELSNTQSNQKHKLIRHFYAELSKFTSEIDAIYDIKMVDPSFISLLIGSEKTHFSNKMEFIFTLEYKEWFNEIKELYVEIFGLYKMIGYIDKNFIITFESFISEHFLLYLQNLIDAMRFLKEEEISVLCYIYSEIENLKLFIHDQLLELSFEGLINDKMEVDMSRFSEFNIENLKLIKSLAMNDIKNLLKPIKSFIYISDDVKRGFFIDLTNITSVYKMEHSYDLILKFMASLIDDFILNNILLSIKFTSEQYFEFKEFFNNLEEIFDDYEWKTRDGVKCLDALFEGRHESDFMFKLLEDLYDH